MAQTTPTADTPPLDQLNPLERSFADIARANRFIRFTVAYCGEQFGARHRFEAVAHFNDAAEGQIPCASGSGATIANAIDELRRSVEAKRTMIASLPIYGEAGLMESAQ